MTDRPLDDDDMTTTPSGDTSVDADGQDAGPGPDTGPRDSDDADGQDAGPGPDTGPRDSDDAS
ncbi:conserved hypothetical protein [Nostocoides japonicum T1-X7]|uniref:Uncharacterized protein n=1 Tax=Nostocoides japonicum T1-X7 TaxID=1194083 RepID=A0A077M8E7_9MICO|nr:hypothetical protein [Tetrasphaera japonica]CCH80310.1 conserved hypothetical protein [Tetrasphaera japonica T1-X7]